MGCVPKVSVAVVQVALPWFDGDKAEQLGITVPLSVKDTVPERDVFPGGADTVTVNVTDWLVVDGFAEDVRARLVEPLPTDCERVPLLVV